MYEWDEVKNKANKDKHGVSFENAVDIFQGLVVVGHDARHDYQEDRHRAIGAIDGIVLVVTYTMRQDNVRIISARPANKKERGLYYEAIKKAAK